MDEKQAISHTLGALGSIKSEFFFEHVIDNIRNTDFGYAMERSYYDLDKKYGTSSYFMPKKDSIDKLSEFFKKHQKYKTKSVYWIAGYNVGSLCYEFQKAYFSGKRPSLEQLEFQIDLATKFI